MNKIIYPYLFFHYLTAVLKMNRYSKPAKKEVKTLMDKFEKKLKTNIVGFLPQFINSDEPFDSIGVLDHSGTFAECYVFIGFLDKIFKNIGISFFP